MEERFEAPGDLSGEDAARPYTPEEEPVTGILAVVRMHDQKLLGLDGVEGVAAGKTSDGRDAIVIYTRDQSVAARLPETIDDYPVEVVVTGTITAY